MKLLFIAPYIYAPEHKEHRKNKTGFGFMVHDIATGAGKQGDQVVLTTYAFGPERHCDGFSIAPNSLLQNIFHGHYRGLFRFCIRLKKNGASFKNILKGAYYYLHTGYIQHLVKKEKPDLVHIHGCTIETDEIINTLQDLAVPYVVTLHGLLQDDLDATSFQKKYEQSTVSASIERNIPITVISSKMKTLLLSPYYGLQDASHITVVANGTDVSAKKITCDIRKKHDIADNKMVILSVGTGCERKNQIQTVRAFSLLPDVVKEKCVLLFAGTVYEGYPLQEEISKLGLDVQIRCLGFIPREDLCNYYQASNLTITASVSEGFGLPMIEGFVYGVPCVAFADLDAIGDIYDECAMHLCKERSDEALANAIHDALSRTWDKGQIQNHAQKFSLEVMSQKYRAVYEKLLRQ